MEYDVAAVEAKWQDIWEREKIFYTTEDPERPKYYNLQMYPYPSGDLHMGHLRNYTYVDLLTRYRRMQGYNVMSPMGWDSFGLPAENAAIATGVHPREFTERQIARMKSQLRRLGAVYDWSREVACHTPQYYKWDQWLFLKLYEQGLAYKSRSAVNWCEQDQTVLANEQVVNGACERCDYPVTRRDLSQWHFRITAYADRLLDDLEGLDWPDRVKTMQENWIGRSEGCDFTIEVEGGDGEFEVYTTRPDTIFGMTFAVLAPEHPLVERLVAGTGYEGEHPLLRGEGVGGQRTGENGHRREVGDLHRAPLHQPGQRQAGPPLHSRLRADGVRDRGHHGRAGGGSAGLGVRRPAGFGDHPHRPPPGRIRGRGVHGRRSVHQLRLPGWIGDRRRQEEGSSDGWRSGGSDGGPSSTASATGWSPASATGGVPSP